jgi:hypothetical protein
MPIDTITGRFLSTAARENLDNMCQIIENIWWRPRPLSQQSSGEL